MSQIQTKNKETFPAELSVATKLLSAKLELYWILLDVSSLTDFLGDYRPHQSMQDYSNSLNIHDPWVNVCKGVSS